MKRAAISFCLLSLSIFSQLSAADFFASKPKLVVVIVIDQFRADYLTRYREEFLPARIVKPGSKNVQVGGFRYLMENGAYFPFGQYDVLQSMTAVGHATILSGSYPYMNGIPLNEWYNQDHHSSEYNTEDHDYGPVGLLAVNEHSGTSPRNFHGTTVGDELKNSDSPSRVVSLSMKDRAAILLGGYRSDLSFWYEPHTGQWISSKFYLPDGKLPDFLIKLNKEVDGKICDLLLPCSPLYTVDAFERAVKAYKLGQSKATDLIAVSFSGHDYVGHRYGPNSAEIKAITLAEDKSISDLLNFIDHQIPGGLAKSLVVFTADHGVAPSVEYSQRNHLPGAKIAQKEQLAKFEKALDAKFGHSSKGSWISYFMDFNYYLNSMVYQDRRIQKTEVEVELKRLILEDSHFAFAFTEKDYLDRKLPPGMLERQILKTYVPGRSGDVIGIPRPFVITDYDTATHLTGYAYDRSVPIIFSGMKIKAGTYAEKAEVVDIAPTLSFLLGILPPALSEGKVLKSAIAGVN